MSKINGIDVSKCKHYDIDNNYCDQSYLGEGGLLKNTKNPKKCEQSPNCYFKQLKRLQEENKKLKEENNIYENSIIANHDRAVGKRLMEVLQALEEIREKLKKYDANIGDTIIANPIQDCYDTYKLINEVLNDRD